MQMHHTLFFFSVCVSWHPHVHWSVCVCVYYRAECTSVLDYNDILIPADSRGSRRPVIKRSAPGISAYYTVSLESTTSILDLKKSKRIWMLGCKVHAENNVRVFVCVCEIVWGAMGGWVRRVGAHGRVKCNTINMLLENLYLVYIFIV